MWYGKEEYEPLTREEKIANRGSYRVTVECENCGCSDNYEIPKGTRIANAELKCTNCGVPIDTPVKR